MGNRQRVGSIYGMASGGRMGNNMFKVAGNRDRQPEPLGFVLLRV